MAGATIALPARARLRIRAWCRRFLAGLVVGLGLLALYMLWFRDSSLVAVKTVQVEGATDPKLEKALGLAGREMTTLHVRQGVLDEAARPFTEVESVSADPSPPSSLTVQVTKRRPAALIGEGSGAVAVADDGTVLRGVPTEQLRLPRLPLSSPPKRPRIQGPVLQQARVLGAAPPTMRRYVDHSFAGARGVGVTLAGGVEMSFGDAAGAEAKWRAAAAVLSDPDLGPLDYVDVSVPRRPAVGGAGHTLPAIAGG